MIQQYQCQICPEKCIDASEFLNHFEIHKSQNEELQNMKQNVNYKNNFLNKENSEYPSLKNQSSKAKKSIEQIAECEICNKRFVGKQSLRRHIITFHDNDRTHTCDVCSKAFGIERELRLHKNSVHGLTQNFKCLTCGKSFGQRGNLVKHEKVIHEKIKDHKCESCGKTFGSKANLNIHVKIVHENQRDFNCDTCGKRFGHMGNLNNHIEKVHLKIIKYFYLILVTKYLWRKII